MLKLDAPPEYFHITRVLLEVPTTTSWLRGLELTLPWKGGRSLALPVNRFSVDYKLFLGLELLPCCNNMRCIPGRIVSILSTILTPIP